MTDEQSTGPKYDLSVQQKILECPARRSQAIQLEESGDPDPQIFLPSTLGRLAIHDWAFPPHIQKLQRAALDLLYDPDFNRLVIEIPVRHGKSFFWSYIFPAWLIMIQPHTSIFVISYNADFAKEWSNAIRNAVTTHGKQLTGITLDPNWDRQAHFRLEYPMTGQIRSMGIWGALSGKGANLIICDDLVKEFSEVATEETRNKLYRQFHGELLGRLEPGGKVVMVMSRRHPDDLSGRLLASNPQLKERKQWRRLKFPALDEIDGALWPERYPREELEAIRRDYEIAGTHWIWHSLYQQDPTTAAELCEWPASYWEKIWYDELPDFTSRYKLLAIDPAMGKDRVRGAFAAMLVGLIDPHGTLWIEQTVLVRRTTQELEDAAARVIDFHKPDAVAIEVGNLQLSIAENINRKVAGGAIYAYESVEKKEVRIRIGLTPLLASQRIRIKNTPQGRILGQQLRDFPLASHDSGPAALTLLCQLWGDLRSSASGEPSGAGDRPVFTH